MVSRNGQMDSFVSLDKIALSREAPSDHSLRNRFCSSRFDHRRTCCCAWTRCESRLNCDQVSRVAPHARHSHREPRRGTHDRYRRGSPGWASGTTLRLSARVSQTHLHSTHDGSSTPNRTVGFVLKHVRCVAHSVVRSRPSGGHPCYARKAIVACAPADQTSRVAVHCHP
jgi:hypothetical protein